MAKKEEKIQEPTGQLYEIPLEKVMPDSMLPYAEYVILDRALPRVEDGLKPVQRRILFTMHEMGLFPDKPHKKSARIVGECMGKYHPHGDSSVYDAMVRLAQDFNMGATLVNGHGNFGSVDGDPAAAMRYTEARLEPLALELLRDLDKDTVHFSPNFDDSLKEPDLLPGRFPNLLVNGASGIAVGLATNIPTHNLAETIDGAIAMIDDPKITLKEMMKIIPAPDFSTGGYIIANELEQAYETGKGKIFIRAKMHVEPYDPERRSDDRKNIVITEIPYQVNKANLLRKIASLKEEKKDEKKDPIMENVINITDESDRVGMRAVITVKKDTDIPALIKYLCKNTDLEVSFGINIVALAEGKPQQLGLLKILKYYVNYQREVVFKRTKYELEQAKERSHILEGLITAVRNIDEVIAIIKKAESTADAREKLCAKFSLSERQAQAILDLRLSRLTKLEVFKLEEELKQLKALIAKLTFILSDKKNQFQVVKEELLEIKKKYKRARRSEVVYEEDDIVLKRTDEKAPAKNCYFLYTQANRIKVVDESAFNSAKKTGDSLNDIYSAVINTVTDKKICFVTDKGSMYKLDIDSFECRLNAKGTDISEAAPELEEGELPVAFFEYDPTSKEELIFFSAKGMIKRTAWSDYDLNKDYFQAVRVNEGDRIIGAEIFKGTKDNTIFFVTKNGICLNAETDDIPVQGRISAGVKGMSLKGDDEVVFASQIDGEGEIVVANDANKFKRVISSQVDPLPRYRKGVMIMSMPQEEKVIFANYVTNPYMLSVLNADGSFTELSTEDISIEPTSSKGRKIRGRSDIDAKAVFALKYRPDED